VRFQNGSNKVAIELHVVQFWSEIILVISDQIALHSVQLPLFRILRGELYCPQALQESSLKIWKQIAISVQWEITYGCDKE